MFMMKSPQFDAHALSEETEGILREKLAHYFLSSGSCKTHGRMECQKFRYAQRMLCEIENQAILRSIGYDRPLQIGDPALLINACFEACRYFAQKKHLRFVCNTFQPSLILCGIEPHLLMMTAVGLVRECMANNRHHTVKATVKDSDTACYVVVKSRYPITDQTILQITKETARLHGGSMAVSNGSTAFYVRKNLSGLGICRAPSVDELIGSPLSCVQTGFYSSL